MREMQHHVNKSQAIRDDEQNQALHQQPQHSVAKSTTQPISICGAKLAASDNSAHVNVLRYENCAMETCNDPPPAFELFI